MVLMIEMMASMSFIPSKISGKQRILSLLPRRENRGIERVGQHSSGCTVGTKAAASDTKSSKSRSRPISSPKLMLVRTVVLSP